MNIDRLKTALDELMSQKEHLIVAIDGPCASGKTTLAEKLIEIYDANIFHADDFFLRVQQRTPERLSEVGGNFDRERFMEEIILPLLEKRDFSYSPFSCTSQTLCEKVNVQVKKLNIVEGSYSQHPYFGDVYDLKVFLDISKEEQKRRILLREPAKAKRFFEEWIPKENEYLKLFAIKENSDIVLNNFISQP